ncbi:CBS domain-containing protein [Streptomyces sp. HNM0645]|uniref:CBS domain-containing protein n=1 Tax=Streptomyces sp. HNM0645 TaxID=2782343 RepID=UPI0024B6EBC2|nr:CBS domain-containing protein [Streptomyces sp. HNM0645]MDI9885104.1 CBS domain-containing protein [Streptomyces sp. HNM0645]
MTDRESPAAGVEARRAVPGRASRIDEPLREDMLLRYIGAMAAASARHQEPRSSAGGGAPARPARTGHRARSASDVEADPLLVRDVMEAAVASVPGDSAFMAIARALTDAGVGSLPVTDPEGRVMGVVSESDLLAKAAVEATGHRPGVAGTLARRRLNESARAETAEDLMTAPAITVFPESTVAEAAWLAALSRLKRMPVTDEGGHLVGVVRRNALLASLVRDDEGIREEIVSRILVEEFPGAGSAVEITVRNGTVDVWGRMERADARRFLERIEGLADVAEVVDHLVAA